MKNTQLLSVVLSLIMVFGVSTGSAFAQTDDNADNIDDDSMEIENFDDDTHDDDRDDEDDINDKHDDLEDKEDDINDKHDDLEDKLENFCEMTTDEKNRFLDDHPRIAQFKDRLTNYCDLSEDERDYAIEDFIKEHIHEARNHDDYDLGDMLDMYCDMTDKEKKKFVSTHDVTDDHIAKVNAYCELDDDERDAYLDKHEDEFRMDHDKKMKEKLEQYCGMSDSEKRKFLDKNDKTASHAEKMNMYCELDDDDGKMKFIDEHRDEYLSHMKKKMMSEYKKEHMMSIDEMKDKHKQTRDHKDYSKLCEMTEGERILKIDNPEKLERVSEWCEMTPEERDAFKKEHHDATMDFKEKHHDTVKTMKEKHELSPRLKEMILTSKHDISDERMNEIKMKYKEKYGDLNEAKKSELKMKFKTHMSSIKTGMSDEHKSAIHDRVAEMKSFKADLREKASNMTDEEKQQLREEFIEKAKEMQLAWISPRIQMTAGIDASEIECREGFNLVMKASNGVPICLKSDTALKMIEKGIAVPAN